MREFQIWSRALLSGSIVSYDNEMECVISLLKTLSHLWYCGFSKSFVGLVSSCFFAEEHGKRFQ